MNSIHPLPSLRNVSDTALWVAMYRAMESDRPDALFDDPLARRMAGARGEAIAGKMPGGRAIAGPMTVRTAVIDEMVLACIARGACTVVNLGAGLDTRAFRLELPPALHWIDVDLLDMVIHRRKCLGNASAACHHSHMVADVCDAQAVESVLSLARSTSGPVLVLTEGLLLYLTEDQVARLAGQLLGEPQVAWWIGDLISPMLCATSRSIWNSQLTPDAAFRFAPRDRAGFFARLGWHEREFRSTWDESIRLKRAQPWAAWWTAFGQPHLRSLHEGLRQSSGVALLEAQGETKVLPAGSRRARVRVPRRLERPSSRRVGFVAVSPC